MTEGRRSRRDRSRSRSRERLRHHVRERARDRDGRSHDRDSDSHRDSRHHDRHRSERRERSWDRGKARSDDDDRWQQQQHGAGWAADHVQGAYTRTFTSAGRVFEDNGGMPQFERDERRSPHRSGRDDDRRWRDGHAAPRSAYEVGIAAGLDGDYDPFDGDDDDRRRWRGSSRGAEAAPTNTLFVRGIPDGRHEEDLAAVFRAWPGFREARLSRERGSGSSKGFGFVEFDSVDAAAAVMAPDSLDSFQLDGCPLRLEYSASQRPGSYTGTGGSGANGGGGGGGGSFGRSAGVMDWVCDRCSTSNFARCDFARSRYRLCRAPLAAAAPGFARAVLRMECHNCSTPRPANPRRVAAEMDAPSHILKLSNLDPMVTAEAIAATAQSVAPVLDVRIVNDKFTGQPRGFAFVHFASIADAARVLHAFNNTVVEELQQLPWRLCYARDKAQPAPSAAVSAGADALQAAQAMQQYCGWAPKEFDEAALDTAAPTGSAAQQQQRPGGGQGGSSGDVWRQQQQEPQRPAPDPSTFVYDPNTGYQYDPATGLYYDANTRFFYDSNAQIWLAYDYQTGQYAPAGGAEAQQAHQQQSQQQHGDHPQPGSQQQPQQYAAQPALPSGNGSGYYEMPAASTGALPAAHAGAAPAATAAGPAPDPAAAAKPPVAKRRVATIGSKPQLNPEAVAAAARAAEVEKLRQEKLHLAEGLCQKKAALKAKAVQKPPAASGPANGPPGASAASSGVQGVIHRGKWAPKPS